jgi:RHS repeat-associated protein
VTSFDAAYQNAAFSSRVGNPFTFTGRELDSETGLMHFRTRTYDTIQGRFKQRDPIGYSDGTNLYAGYFIPNGLDPSGLAVKDCCSSSGTKKQYDDEQECCENGAVVQKTAVYVINRSGGVRTGTTGGHIDLAIPGTGMVGFYGAPNGKWGNGVGMRMTGYFNNTPAEWNRPGIGRPAYAAGAAGGVLSTICEVKVCPADAAKMGADFKKRKAAPGTFNLVGRNCSTQGANILGAGGVLPGGIPGTDNPQNLIDALVKKHGAKCFNGFTAVNPAGKVTITMAGPAPAAPPPGTSGS